MSGQLVKIFNTKMGNNKSTKKGANRAEKQNSKSDMQFNGSSDNRDLPMEDPEISKLKRSIKNNPEVFILNNLMMCVDFFKNYDEEISEMRETLVSPNETALNKRLLPQKRVLLPDILQERIVNNVTFISRRETVDPTVEPLQPVRMFVVYENIEVSDQHDSSQYSTMNDTITYNMRLKPSIHKGYVHLERIEITPSKRNPRMEEVDLSSIAENGNECFSDSETLYTSQSGSQDYGYNSSKSKNTSHKNRSNLSSSKITKSTPNLADESDEVFERFPGRSKLMENFQGYKDDTDYGFVSDSKSSQSQRRGSREPRSKKRGFNRNSQHPQIKTRSVSASPASSTSSGYKSGNYDTDSEVLPSGFTTGKGLNKSKILDAAEMPDSCFSLATYPPTENSRKNIISSKERRVQVERNRYNYDVWYLNSTRFRRYFYNVFIECLAPLLGLEEVIRFCRPLFFGSVIYCDKVEINQAARCNISESYEIIPCVWTQWPECANEWLERPRNSWPNYETIHHIRKSGCYIIPQEFRSKDDQCNCRTEWQLAFPAAERYLETCMSHSQMRVYIIVLMLHKTFIRAVESTPDRLNVHQIRNQLFWLMEQSLQDWSENKTGDYLLRLLQCLCKCINQDEAFLKDYFLEEKNLFKNSEKGSLFFSLKQLKRILENPVMYVLHALENIRYKSEIFPKLNYEELLKILTTEELLLINPNLQKDSASAMQQNFMEDEYSVRRGFWDDAKKNKEHFSNFHRKPVTNKTAINPSRAHDSVVDIAIRCGELKGIRLSKLLDFFIEHMIKMAKQYHLYGALQQKTEYLQHAMSLSIILAEDEMFQDEARSYIQVIVSLQRLVTRSCSRDEPPETPKRNVETPNFFSTTENNFPNVSTPFPNKETTAKSTKTISDPSIFSSSLKDRYSSLSNRSSLHYPDASASSSRNNSPPVQKKSDPPAYFRSFKDRFSISSSDVPSTPLPVVEEIISLSHLDERGKNEDFRNDSSFDPEISLKEKIKIPDRKTTFLEISKVSESDHRENTVPFHQSVMKEKEIFNGDNSSLNPRRISVKEKIEIYSNKEQVFSEINKVAETVLEEKKNDVSQSDKPNKVDFAEKKINNLRENSFQLHQSATEEKKEVFNGANSSFQPKRISVKDQIKIYSNREESFSEINKVAETVTEKTKNDISQSDIPGQVHFPERKIDYLRENSVHRRSEEKKENESFIRGNSSLNEGRSSVKEKIKIYSKKKEETLETNKKISQESNVISLTVDDDDSFNDTYI